jgi:dGTPase
VTGRDTQRRHPSAGPGWYERSHAEPSDRLRSPFEVDRHRVIECTAFRRLERKTQVFSPAHHDHFRTRLTHTLEVADIARTLASRLGADERLAEVIALAHDLGHPPFGHAGEAALDESLADSGGFNHNAHALRVVTYLEHPFPAFRGLNLTRAVLDGLSAHETRYDRPEERAEGAGGCSIEADIASLSDRLAYGCHDLEDAIGAGLISADELHELALWREAEERAQVSPRSDGLHAVRRPVLDALLGSVLTDVVAWSSDRVVAVRAAHTTRPPDASIVVPSSAVERQWCALEDLLLRHVYRHPAIAAVDALSRRMVRSLFRAYVADSALLPERFSRRVSDQGLPRVVGDYVAGMTDGFCRAACERVGATG